MPDELADSFWRYERAVVQNDLHEMDELFVPGDAPLRADSQGLLVGHSTISAFRSTRGGVAERTLTMLEPRPLPDGAWVVSAQSDYAVGGFGIQTQVWVRTDAGWRILAAHVTPRVAPSPGLRATTPSIDREPAGDPTPAPAPASPTARDRGRPSRAPGQRRKPLPRALATLRDDPARMQLIAMLALTFSTGVIDAVGYLGLDRVFTANMTGNIVILGMALTGAEGLPIIGPAVALLGFAAGAAVAGRMLRGRSAGWTSRTTAVFAAVGAALALTSIATAVLPQPGEHVLTAITAVLAISMGMQAGAARHVAVKDVTTVVVTSTLTGLAADSVFGARAAQHPWPRRLGSIALIGAGAALGALTLHVGLWLGVAVSALFTIVVTVLGHIGRPVSAETAADE